MVLACSGRSPLETSVSIECLGSPLNKLWDWTIGSVIAWARQLASPSELVRSCLQESDWMIVIAKFWAFPIVLSIAIDGALVLHAYGLDLHLQPTALLLYFVYTCLKWLIAATAIILLLKLFGLTSRFNVVVSCYTIVVIYAPIFSLSESPNAHYQLSVLSQVKAQHLDLIDSIKYLVLHVKEMKQPTVPGSLLFVLANLEGVFVLVSSVFAAESLTQYLLNDRLKTYLAVWLSSLVSFFPTVLLTIFKTGVVYSYIK
jgi:hypothetical protein